MAKKITMNKRIVSLVLSLALFVSLLPVMARKTMAATTFVENRKADVSTMNDWKKWFGSDVLNTENAGGVWGDKSVFTDASAFSEYGITMSDANNNFLVALSAIASNKSIVGYSAIPTDTVMVLDLSGSMSSSSVSDMIDATNDAIRELQALNRNNRVSVVVYAGTRISGNYYNRIYGLNESATVLLPLGRYTGVQSYGGERFLQYSENSDTVSVVNGVLQGQRPSKEATGATYIQAGLQLAWNQFDAVDDTIIMDGPQKGTQRMPVLVLMSDGAPTAATTSFTNVGNSTHGNGGDSSSENAFLTQLSCVWVRTQMEKKYGRSSLFYTLGLDVENSDIARSVLNPSVSNETISGYWDSYLSATGDSYSNREFTVAVNSDVKNFFKTENSYEFSSYINQYFQANSNSSGNQLTNAFEQIVNTIIIQSKYYPTLVQSGNHDLDGYITFTDELGEYMEVKEIKGLTVAGSLYQGSALSKAVVDGKTFGNVLSEDTEQLTPEGRAFLNAIQRRLNCSERDALAIAAQAIRSGQISYNANTGAYSNYIGWYADEDGNLLGFWDGKEIDYSVGATYVNKSYGFLGVVGSDETYNKTDMLYVSVQVHKHIQSGHEQVIYRIPASLVPMVEYEIEFTGTTLEDGTDFRMAVKGAKEPLRLIFEVGLRSDINPVNITEKIDPYYKYKNDANGYTFYTNSWANHSHSEDVALNPHDSAHFEFEPSLENERYHYAKNTPIFDAFGNPVDYDPKTVSGTYYWEYIAFKTSSASMSSAEMVKHMIPISEGTLKTAVYDETFQEWVIPKGTPFHIIADPHGTDYAQKKADPTITNTSVYSNYPSIFHTSAEANYHAAGCLGNNGVFTITPEQGIAVTKIMEYPELGQNEIFTFEIVLEGQNLPASYPVYNFNGELLKTLPLETGNKLTVTLKPGETVYITDVPTGTKYSATEVLPAGSEWRLKQVTGAAGTVTLYDFSEIVFENTPTTYGNLLISKTVKHPFGDNYVLPSKSFDVTVTFTSGVADGTKVMVNEQEKTVTNGQLNLSLRHGESAVISGIPEGAVYQVTEASYPGFTMTGTGLTGTISDSKNAEALLTNTYRPAEPDLNLSHVGIKHLDGRDWLDGDSFSFVFQYFNGVSWVNLSTQSATVGKNTPNHSFSFDDLLEDFEFTTVGTYQFRVLESFTEIGGVLTDNSPKQFAVTVVDDNLSGKLKISSVDTTTPNTANTQSGTVVTYDTANDTWIATTHFQNTYSARGTAEVRVEINKQIQNDTGLPFGKDGFTFQIWEIRGTSEVLVGTTNPTNGAGETEFTFSLDANRLGQTMTYKIVEVVDGKEGVLYDASTKTFTVTLKDNLNGTVSAWVDGKDTSSYAAEFTNTYDLADATVTVHGEKALTGRDLVDGEFVFELYRCADSNFADPQRVDRQHNVGKNFTLTDTLSAAGTYYYIVKEASTQLPNVTVDSSEYRVTVMVSKGTGATLKAEVVSVTKNGANADLKFTNVYEPNPTELAIFGSKTMTGRDPRNGEFFFLLFDDAGQQIGRVSNDADGNFVFPAISYSQKGTYVYTVKEDLSDKKSYISYDESVFTVTVTVTDDNAGTLSKTVSYAKGNQAVNGIAFHNTYKPTAISNAIEGYKSMSGRNPGDQEFTFLLFDADGTKIGTATNDGNGKFSFAPITYSSAGIYTYTVRESLENRKDYIVYDESVYTVTVTVTDDGVGNLSKQISYRHGAEVANGISFNNVYTPDAINNTISGTKTMIGRALKAGEFRFLLFDASGTQIGSATNGQNGTFSFAPIEYTHAGTYTYTVKEDLSDKKSYIGYDEGTVYVTVVVSDDGKGNLSKTVTYGKENSSANGVFFENTYKPTPVKVPLDGIKTMTGRDPRDNEFTFLLLDASGAVVDSAENKGGAFVFDELTFSAAGTYVYTVKEDLSSKKPYIGYDETVITVTITVTDDTVGGLTATVAYASAAGELHDIAFHNRYLPTAIQSVILGQKNLEGRKLLGGEFTFLLMNASGEVLDRTTNAEDGTISFAPRLYRAAGVYTYVVKEDASVAKDGVKFDANEYTVTVTVTDDGLGTLSSKVEYAPKTGNGTSMVFNNVFTPAPVQVTFFVNKVLNNNTKESIGLDGFEFTLAGDGLTSATVKSDAAGKAVFAPITYTSEDIGKTFRYTVVEVDGGREYMVYDKTVAEISVTVTVTEDGKLVPVLVQNGKTVENVTVTFTNTYHKNPDTSDLNLRLWILLGALGLCSSGTLLLKKRETAEE